MAETIRLGRLEDVGPAARLITHSFVGRTVAEMEDHLLRGPWSGVESLWVAEDAGRLAAACQLHPLRQWIGGVAMPVMGVGTVAVGPTYRRRGLAGRMLAAGLHHAYERGDIATALYPFRAAYYAQLGYALVGEARQYRLAPQALPDAPADRARVRLVETDDDERAMKVVYAAAVRRQGGQLERTERSWQRVWSGEPDGAAVVHYTETGDPDAYAVVGYRTDARTGARYLDVEEQVWLSDEGQRAIYGWLASLGDQWQEILYRAHPDELFDQRIAEPRLPAGSAPGWRLWFPAATLLRGPMFRLLDVPGALHRRTLARAEPVTLRIEVQDALLPQNRGPWRVQMADGGCAVDANGDGAADATLATDIGTLSRIYIGDLAVSDAVRLGFATIDVPQVARRADAAFHLPRPWMFDRF
jgi:predicted acetyltransferase